jgi:thiol-disulfide isomerase/thioredoxin
MTEGAVALAAGLPRYSFFPGQRFDFNPVGEPAENVRPEYWAVWVLASEEGGWRLLVRRRNYRTEVVSVHISPRGELSDWAPAHADLPVEDILPLLPATTAETAWASDGWLPTDYQQSAPQAGQPIEIVGKLANRLGQAFVRERTTTWRLDPARGYVPTEIATRLLAADGSSDEERRVEVSAGDPLSSQQTADLARAAQELSQIEARYHAALAAAAHDPASAEPAVADAWSDLALVRNTIPADLREPLDGLLRVHADEVKEARQNAERLAELRAKPPADWTVADLHGRPHRAADYRGRVVVLDFWFARCGPCLRTIPTLQRLRKAFPETEVVLLGCNVDEDVTEARDIVAKVGEHYPTLLARELDALYGVTAYPTFVILAPDGRVYDSFISEGRPLYEKLASTIRLLSSPRPK